MKLKELLEAMIDSPKTILKNPTKQELLNLAKEEDPRSKNAATFRFILTTDGDFYFALSYNSTHNDIRIKLSKLKTIPGIYQKGYMTYIPTEKSWDMYGKRGKAFKKNKNFKRVVGNDKLNEEHALKTILVNPTKQEFISLIRESYKYEKPERFNLEYRFVLTESGDLYIGNGLELIHSDIKRKIEKLGKKTINSIDGYFEYKYKEQKFIVYETENILKVKKNKNFKKLIGKDLIKSSLNEDNELLSAILFNPTKQELVSFAKKLSKHKFTYGNEADFRFIVDDKDNVYFASGHSMVHMGIITKVKKTNKSMDVKFTGYMSYDLKRNKMDIPMQQKAMNRALKYKRIKKLMESSFNENLNEIRVPASNIIINPTPQQFRNYLKSSRETIVSLRYIVDGKDVYIADAFEYLHIDLSRKINKIHGYKGSNLRKQKSQHEFTDFGTLHVKPNNKIIYSKKGYKNKFIRELMDKPSINESLDYIKFKYDNYKNDPTPRVKILDTDYPGQKGQSNYGERRDLLGWNINYFKNKRYAKRAIDDIESFAKLLSADKDEVYKRIKYFFPEQAKFIRRYMKKHIKHLKHRKGILWRSTTYPEIKAHNREAF